MGVLWKLLAPKELKSARRTVHKVAHPVSAVTPSSVKQARRAVGMVTHPIETAENAVENAVVRAVRGSGSSSSSGRQPPPRPELLASSFAEQQTLSTMEPETEAEPAEEPWWSDEPVTLHGSGKRVLSVDLHQSRPLLISGEHEGESNFQVDIVSSSGQRKGLLNEIGGFSGETLWDDAEAGAYRVEVEADGEWHLRLRQPPPGPDAIEVPTTLNGRGKRVIAIRAPSAFQPIVSASHAGKSNFQVTLNGHGRRCGDYEGLFNEIGKFQGETLIDWLSEGHYYLVVAADGEWEITFAS
jgi:hypothetical protein